MGSPPQSADPPDFYLMIEGEDGLRRLVDRFYDIMDRDPSAGDVRATHGPDLAPVREKLFAFLSGWLGGPRLYAGCVIGAHRRFAITAEARDQWLACMDRALAETHPQVREALMQPLTQIAGVMRNC